MKGKINNPQNPVQSSSTVDRLKWVLVLILLIAGLLANFYFVQIPWPIRAAVGIVWVVLMAVVALWTSKGKKAWSFIKAARGELRKVVWPTRQETTQTTFVVMAMVLVTALVLWGLDSLFFWAVSLVTGQRG